MRKGTKIGLALLALSLMAATAAFPASNRTQAKGTFVIGAEGDPVLLDPSLVSDGTSLRTTFQIFEGLVRNKSGTLKIEPALATGWKASKNGLVWTFPLRKGVTFTDGTPFNSAAVCANFTRWWYRPAQLQGDDVSYYWNTVFGGYAKPAPGGNGPDKSLYHGCKTAGPYTVRIILSRRSTSFLGALALANFGIASPTALKKYNADAGTVGADGQFRPSGTFATQNPIGTGRTSSSRGRSATSSSSSATTSTGARRPRRRRSSSGRSRTQLRASRPCRPVRSTSRTTSRRRMLQS